MTLNNFSVLIIKQAPDLVATGLEKAIGAPEDYNKNLDKGRFPTDLDLKIPVRRTSSVADLEEALEGIDLSDDRPGKKSVAQTAD